MQCDEQKEKMNRHETHYLLSRGKRNETHELDRCIKMLTMAVNNKYEETVLTLNTNFPPLLIPYFRIKTQENVFHCVPFTQMQVFFLNE